MFSINPITVNDLKSGRVPRKNDLVFGEWGLLGHYASVNLQRGTLSVYPKMTTSWSRPYGQITEIPLMEIRVIRILNEWPTVRTPKLNPFINTKGNVTFGYCPSQLKENTPVLFKTEGEIQKGHLSCFEDGTIWVFKDGRSSYTGNAIIPASNVVLATGDW